MFPILYQNGLNFVKEFFKEFLSDQVIAKFKEQLYLVSKRRESYIEYYRRIRVSIRGIDPKMSEVEQIELICNGLKNDPIFSSINQIKSFIEIENLFRTFDIKSMTTEVKSVSNEKSENKSNPMNKTMKVNKSMNVFNNCLHEL